MCVQHPQRGLLAGPGEEEQAAAAAADSSRLAAAGIACSILSVDLLAPGV
jgi:hypothetical protein